jgi:hypothetical protein
MKYSNYIYSLIVTIVIGFLYNRYKRFEYSDEEKASYSMVQKYLINESYTDKDNTLVKNKKPILWIHMNYDINARWWSSFYSRNSMDLNQPYLYLTIKSIIDACGKDFDICLIDDESFMKIMPEWTINVTSIADPIKSKVRELALAKLLYKFGGFLVPPSFICFQSLLPLYTYYTNRGQMFVGEMLNKTTTSSQMLYFPNTTFMGCLKESMTMLAYTHYLESVISQDFVDESTIVGAYGRWCYEKSLLGEVGIIPADKLGIKDADGASITIDRLIQNTFVHLTGDVLGIYIPVDDILNRTAYNWFARLSAKQVLQSDTTIGKYLLITR